MKLLYGCVGLLLSFSAAAFPRMNTDAAICTRSATLLVCRDEQGNNYSVATIGTTLHLRGYEANDGVRWAQTTGQFGELTFFSGFATDGKVWIGTTKRVGWTTITRLSSSDGIRTKISCNRLSGCQ